MRMHRWWHWLLILMIGLLSASCSTGSQPSEEALEGDAEGPPPDYDAGDFEGQPYNFSMSAVLGDIVDGFQDSMESDWAGTFTIDEDGIILGSGGASFSAAIFNTDEGCGYVWFEGADFDFTIHGEVQQREGSTTLSLVVELASEVSPQRTEPAATCGDPGVWRLDTPEIYFDLHRDFMLTDTQLGLSRLAPRIQIGQTLEAQAGGVNYTILVDLPAVPLTD